MRRLISRKVIMRKCYVLWALVLSAVTAAKVPNPEKLKSDVLQRFKRQDLDEDALEKQLCSDKGAGEWFRLETGEDKCRDVIQCTASGLQAIRCPAGLAFDIEKQTCDWKASVKNCNAKTKEKKLNPSSSLMNHCVKRTSWPVEMATALNEAFSAMARRTVMTVPMRTLAILIRILIEHHHVIPPFVNSPIASVQRMAPRYLVTSVTSDLLAPTA